MDVKKSGSALLARRRDRMGPTFGFFRHCKRILDKTLMNLSSSLITTGKYFRMKVSVRVLENHNKSCWQHRSTCKKFKQFQLGKVILAARIDYQPVVKTLETGYIKKHISGYSVLILLTNI